jgi:hypothetical protein
MMVVPKTRHLRRICTAYRRVSVPTQRLRLRNQHPQAQISNFIRNFSDGNKSKSNEEEPKLTIQREEDITTTDKSSEPSEIEINPEEYTREISVELPDFEESKGRIVKWYHEEGDIIRPNDTICDIETDLFTFGMDIEDEKEGILKEILIPAGEEKYKPGTPICTILHKPME